ncbi:MAG: M23 family metallopeptidase [Bacteroidetes bacterium]|nr:M23 family metallopeptidase [Bacteroidota bacterium]HET6244395.1 M23 family metallopeptidase [Bacteroidia bacterium]
MSESKQENRNRLISRLKNKYRLVLLNDDSFEEKISLRLSPLNVFILSGTILIVLITIVISFIAFTPIREFIPGYADVNLRRSALQAVLKADSLEQEIKMKNYYLNSLANVLEGKIPVDEITGMPDSTKNYDNIILVKSKEDSLLRDQIESQDLYSLTSKEERNQKKSISSFFFFTPINGTVTASFNVFEGHYGTDIAAAENEVVKATLNGTVVFSSWTTEYGNVIQIQHEDNMLSVYKHNSVVLKKTGNYVKAGEAIAIIGNSGDLTSGPHLHFELWYNGIAINPQDYIIF